MARRDRIRERIMEMDVMKAAIQERYGSPEVVEGQAKVKVVITM